LWARNVTVTATDPTGGEGEWRFPLTVQPGETMPFEIENWTGTQSPADIDFTITADFSSTIDLTRSLKVSTYYNLLDREFYFTTINYPEEMGAYPFGTASLQNPNGLVGWIEVRIDISESTAHPRLTEAARQQTIENLTVYAATREGGVIAEVWELTPMLNVASVLEPPEWIEVRTIPIESPLHPVPIPGATVGIVGRSSAYIWAGGASPGYESPGDEPQ